MQTLAIGMNPNHLKILETIKSTHPTEYKIIRTDGEALFVYCAMDAILYSMLSEMEVDIETNIFDDNRRLRLSPNTNLWISFIDPGKADLLPNSSETPSNLCPYIKFFRDEKKFQDWKEKLPLNLQKTVTLLSLEDAFGLAAKLLEES